MSGIRDPAPKPGRLAVAGTELYFQVVGEGSPLLLIHGAFASGDAFRPLVPRLAGRHRLILVDLQGHGRTADRDEPLSYERLADDCAAVVEHLGLASCAVAGFSLGGGTALQLAFRHPRLVSRLAVLSAPFRHDGWHREVLAGFQALGSHRLAEFENTFMYRDHVALAPRPGDFPVLLDKLGELLGHRRYDWGDEVSALELPTLIALGDGDSLSPRHAAEFFELLGGGVRDAGWQDEHRGQARLAVLPGVSHYDILRSPLLAECLVAFFAD